MTKNEKYKYSILVCIFLIVSIFAVYWQTHTYDFINFDDTFCVRDNLNIQNGLNLKSIKWAFTTHHLSAWHPLTWLSFMVDYKLYGLKTGEYHITNVLIHLLNSIILFFIFFKISNKLFESAFIAMLFALHPIHTESIAWITERKDVLFAFFGFLSIYFYIDYTREGKNQNIFTKLSFLLF